MHAILSKRSEFGTGWAEVGTLNRTIVEGGLKTIINKSRMWAGRYPFEVRIEVYRGSVYKEKPDQTLFYKWIMSRGGKVFRGERYGANNSGRISPTAFEL